MKTSERSAINFALISAFLVLSFSFITSYFLNQTFLKSNKWVNHTRTVIENAKDIQVAIYEASASLGNYLLSQNTYYVKDLSEFLNNAKQGVRKIQTLTADNVSQQKRVNYFVQLLNEKIDLQYKILSAAQNKNIALAIHLKTGEYIKGLNKKLDGTLNAIVQEENNLLNERISNFNYYNDTNNLQFLLTSLFGELFLLFSIILLNIYLTKKQRIEYALLTTEQELLLSEKKLTIANDRYSVAVKGSNTGLWDWDCTTNHVFYSDEFKRILGYGDEEFPNEFSSLDKILHPDDRKKTYKRIQEHFDKDIPYKVEYRLKTKSGEYHWFQGMGQAIREDGKIVRMAGSLIDISERKKLDKMKNEFISTVSHELRTPLTSIHGSISLLDMDNFDDSKEQKKHLIQIAKNNCERLIRLINDILDIEKIESGIVNFTSSPFELKKLIDEAILNNEAYANKFSVKLHVNDSIPNIIIKSDKDRLMQVMTNLISNAVKFSFEHGTVTVGASIIQDHKVRISVSDEGEGIPENFRPLIFKKFSQADSSASRKQAGTGLGLSISKTIVEKLGGVINFNTCDRGTVFYFDLPSDKSLSDNLTPFSLTNQYQPIEHLHQLNKDIETTKTHLLQKKIDILHVEDDIELSLIVAAGLKNEANLTNAKTLCEAKDKLSLHDYEIIILDLILSDGSSLNLFPELNKRKIPIIIYSAYDLPIAYRNYVNDVFLKSKHFNQDLLDAIKSIKKTRYEQETFDDEAVK